MKKIIILSIIVLSTIIQINAQTDTARWQWMHSIGGIGPGPNTDNQDNITDFRVDQWGNSYMAGWFYNEIDIQNINLQVPPLVTNNQNANNGFIAKFDCEGNVAWASRWGSPNGGRVNSIVPFENYLYAFGGIGTNAGYNLTIDDSIVGSGSWNNSKIMIAKYNDYGNLLWFTDYGSEYLGYQSNSSCVQLDEQGNMYILGFANNPDTTANFYQGIHIPNGYYLLKLDSNANYLDHEELFEFQGNYNYWNTSFNFLELDEEGNIYLGGNLDSAMHTFAGVQPDYGQGRNIAFITKFNNNLNLLWLEYGENIGNTVGNTCFNIKTDTENNVYSTFRARSYKTGSQVRGTIFQGDTVDNTLNSIFSSYKFVINKYDSDGNLVWLKQVNSYRTDENSKLDLYVSKDTIVAFGLIGRGDFNIDSYSINLASTSYMLLKLDTNGNMLDIKFFPTASGSSQTPYGAFLSSSNNFHLVGMHGDYIQFPDSTLFPRQGSGSNRDIFIAKYGTNTCFKCDSVQLAFEVEQNIGYTAQVIANTTQYAASYEWDFGNGQTSIDSLPSLNIVYPDTGTYTVCLTAQNYCDTQTLCKQIHIGCPPPLAQGYTYTTGNNSLNIQSMQVQQYDSYIWYFGDGQSSTDSLPNHQYNTSNVYEVCLVAENTCGVDSACQTINITCPNPSIQQVNLFIDTLSIIANGVILQNTDSVYWNFGDGNSSMQENPIHTYATSNIYEVCLSVYNECGDSTYCQQISVVGTGIINLASGGSVKVYPNPAENYINIELQNSEENLQVSVVDLAGKIQLKTKIRNQKEQLDISYLNQGIYFIELKEKDKSYSVKIIKK